MVVVVVVVMVVVVVVVVRQARRVCNQPLAAINVESYLVYYLSKGPQKQLPFSSERKVWEWEWTSSPPARKKHMLLMTQQKFLRDRTFPRFGKSFSRLGNFLGQF